MPKADEGRHEIPGSGVKLRPSSTGSKNKMKMALVETPYRAPPNTQTTALEAWDYWCNALVTP